MHINSDLQESQAEVLIDPTPRLRGRPPKPFNESSERTKRRKTTSLRQNLQPNVLQFATQMKLRAEGKVDAARVIKDYPTK